MHLFPLVVRRHSKQNIHTYSLSRSPAQRQPQVAGLNIQTHPVPAEASSPLGFCSSRSCAVFSVPPLSVRPPRFFSSDHQSPASIHPLHLGDESFLGCKPRFAASAVPYSTTARRRSTVTQTPIVHHCSITYPDIETYNHSRSTRLLPNHNTTSPHYLLGTYLDTYLSTYRIPSSISAPQDVTPQIDNATTAQ